MSDSGFLQSLADYLGVIRDVLLILLLVVLVASVIAIYRKVSSLLSSTRRTVEDAEDIVSTVSDKIVRPATAGSSVAFGVGKMAAFLLGMRGKKSRAKDRDRDRRRRRNERRGRDRSEREGEDDGEG